MKKIMFLSFGLLLAACSNKYQETGLLCGDATHNSGQAEITLDVNADKNVANIVVNGEDIVLKAQEQENGSNSISYYGTNIVGEQIKLRIVFSENGKPIDYMLGINSDETTYGCYKK